jgi:hypothetical protein
MTDTPRQRFAKGTTTRAADAAPDAHPATAAEDRVAAAAPQAGRRRDPS